MFILTLRFAADNEVLLELNISWNQIRKPGILCLAKGIGVSEHTNRSFYIARAVNVINRKSIWIKTIDVPFSGDKGA